MRCGLFFFLWILFSGPLSGQHVVVNDEEGDIIREFSLVDDGLEESILLDLVSQGFVLARISERIASTDSVRISVIKGNQFRFGLVEILPDSLSESFNFNMHSKRLTDEIYNPVLVNNLASELVTEAEDDGFMLANVRIPTPEIDTVSHQVHIRLILDVGKKFTVQGLWTNDLKTTPKNYLERSLGVSKGDFIYPELLKEIKLRQEETGFFTQVDLPSVVMDDSSRFWIKPMGKEVQANRFDVMVGYVPNQIEGSGTVVGNVDMSIRNIFYEGSTTHLLFQRLQPFVSKMNLSYGADWIAGSDFSSEVDLFFIQQDSSYLFRRLGGEIGYQLNRRNRIVLGVKSQNAVGGGALLANEVRRVADANSLFFTAGFSVHTLDSRENPTQGMRLDLRFEEGSKNIIDRDLLGGQASLSWRQRFIHLHNEIFVPMKQRQTIRLRSNAYWADSPGYFEDDMSRFGGALTLRGFNEDQFFASKMWWSDLEYRYLLDRNSFAFLFVAQGAYDRPAYFRSETMRKIVDYPRSGGLGLSFITNVGRLMITYASAAGEPFSDGKIHVSLVGRL